MNQLNKETQKEILMDTVSIIIPAYNEEKYIKRTLESIQRQSYKKTEIIVVCNGCIDKTAEIARKYTPHVLNLAENNVSLARNRGAQQAQGTIVIFVDADTILSPETIETIVKINKEGPSFFGTVNGKTEHKTVSCLLYVAVKNIINSLYPWANGIIFCKKEDFVKTIGFNQELTHGEWSRWYKEIKKYSTYKKITNAYVITSQRRMKEWGLKKMLTFWIGNSKQNKGYKAIR
mgnify:CR=1 FL=1